MIRRIDMYRPHSKKAMDRYMIRCMLASNKRIEIISLVAASTAQHASTIFSWTMPSIPFHSKEGREITPSTSNSATLMEEILHHLGCMKAYKWDKLRVPTSTGERRISAINRGCSWMRVSVLLTGPRHFIKPSTVSRNLSDETRWTSVTWSYAPAETFRNKIAIINIHI